MKIQSFVVGVLAITFLACVGPHCQASDFTAQLDEIRTLLKPVETDTPQVRVAKNALQSLPDTWQNLLDKDQFSRFSEYGPRQTGVEISVIPGLSEKFSALGKSVSDEAIRRENAKISDIEALIARTGEALKNAKKPEDLDTLLLAFSNFKSQDNNNPKLYALSQKANSARDITADWQEYLIARETGNTQACTSKLQEISAQLTANPVIPKSMVLRLLNPSASSPAPDAPGADAPAAPASPQYTLDQIKTMLTESGDSAAALAQLKSLPKTKNNPEPENYFIQAVQAVDDLRKLEPSMSESEVLARIGGLSNYQYRDQFTFTRAIDQIILNTIARNYGIEVQSARTTSARNVLESIAISARDQQDWPKLRKILLLRASLDNRNQDQHPGGDLQILSLIELAKTAEQQNDLETAIPLYVEASAIEGNILRRSVTYGILANLKKKDPGKIAPLIEKASAVQQARTGYGGYQPMRDNLAGLRPIIREIIVELQNEKHAESTKPVENKTKAGTETGKKVK